MASTRLAILPLISLLFLSALRQPVLAAPVVVINGETFSEQEIIDWWQSYRPDPDTPFPPDPAPFIDWHLLVQEARRMDLEKSPSFRHKVEVFLKVRAINQLRYDEVESKIQITDAMIRRRYQERYQPRYLVTLRFFHSRDEAEAARSTMTDSDDHHRRWLRPATISPAWRAALNAIEPGGITEPVATDGGFLLLALLEKRTGDDADLASLAERIKKELRKEEEARLTAALLDRLMAKYQVEIDDDLLAATDITADPGEAADEILVTTKRESLSVGDFVRLARQAARFDSKAATDSLAWKQKVVRDILAHNLVAWEALDRGYERHPPLAPIYRFYRGHRLIRELEGVLIAPRISVAEEDITRYYKTHLDDFTPPAFTAFLLFEGSKEMARKVWVAALASGDLAAAAKTVTGTPLSPRSGPVAELPVELAGAIGKLTKGEISRPLALGGQHVVIQLLDRRLPPPRPLEEVRDQVIEILQREQFAAEERRLVEQIRNQSTITVDKQAWQTIAETYQ